MVGLENVSAISNFGRENKSPLPLLSDMKVCLDCEFRTNMKHLSFLQQESYDIGSEHDDLYGNIWPPKGVCDMFRPTFQDFFEACYRVQLLILEAISQGLGLSTQTLGQLHVAQHNELRLIHYPAVSRDEFSHSTRLAPHTDFGSITLLFQDRVGGLQVELPPNSGTFVDIASGGPHECIINAGDCMQRWADLPAARHRVHLPELSAEDVVNERFSIAYFAKPDRTASLRPLLDGLVSEDQAASTFMTAGEFQLMRIQKTYT